MAVLIQEGIKLLRDYQEKQLSVEFFDRQIAGFEKRAKPVRNLEVDARRKWHAWAMDNPDEVVGILQVATEKPIEWGPHTTLDRHERLPSPFPDK